MQGINHWNTQYLDLALFPCTDKQKPYATPELGSGSAMLVRLEDLGTPFKVVRAEAWAPINHSASAVHLPVPPGATLRS